MNSYLFKTKDYSSHILGPGRAPGPVPDEKAVADSGLF